MSTANNQVSLNIDQLKDFMNHVVSNNRYLQAGGKNPVAVEIVGESGIGKTSSILQLGNELGLNIVKLNLAQIEELGDLVGYPVRQFQLCKEAAVGTSTTKTVMKKRLVKKTVEKEIVVMESRQVEEFDITIMKKQVLEAGKFVTKEIEQKIPRMVTKEVPVTQIVTEEIDVEEEYPETVTSMESSAGECLWIDEQAVEEYAKQGYSFTGNKRMSYCPPEWIADKQGGGILILDDWNRAD